jgi:prolyl-tRNA editing enzyme YbaK/EbsC (Cys-tRNA(Pro) deacylase)
VKSALDVHTALLGLGVPHEIVRLDSRISTADDLPRVLGLPSGGVAVRSYAVERAAGSSLTAVLVRAGTWPARDALLEVLGACSVSVATSEQVSSATDFAAGLVCPVALPPGVELLVDEALLADDVCYCAVGEAGVALGVRTADLVSATRARVLPLPTGDSADGLVEKGAPEACPWTSRCSGSVAEQGLAALPEERRSRPAPVL